MYKLGQFNSGEWIEHSYPPVYHLPRSSEELQRIVVGVRSGDTKVFSRLVEALEAPYYLLYVLHTPRGEGKTGRYQSPEISGSEFKEFVIEFKDFLAQDARFDIWIHSPTENATVVWDRHNQIFAYGPLARYESELKALGYSPGEIEVPAPHTHNYHSELDSLALKVLQHFVWSHTPLKPEDEQ